MPSKLRYHSCAKLAVLWPSLPLFILTSCSRPQSGDYLKGNAMGTFYTAQYWSKQNVRHQELTTEIESLLDHFEKQLSNWRPDSWVNRFNQTPANEAVPVPVYAFEILELCLELAERSEGAFDPTIAPLIELWGFGTRRDKKVPEESEIQASIDMIGYRKLILDRKNRTLRKTKDGTQLNCSAVAKGYAADLIARLFEAKGIQNFLINIGGEVTAKGTNIDGSVWQIGIASPRGDRRQGKPEVIFPLKNRSLATSGHSQRAFVIEGIRYSHILDPRTGYPTPTETASATVLAPSCALADGLATIALILNEEQLTQLLEYYDAEVYRSTWGAL